MTRDLILQAGSVVAALTAILAFMLLVARTATKIAAPHFAEAVHKSLNPMLNKINDELSFNGGSTVKDITLATSKSVESLSEQLTTFTEYQHERNHDLLSRQVTLLSTVKVLHKDDLDALGIRFDDVKDPFNDMRKQRVDKDEEE